MERLEINQRIGLLRSNLGLTGKEFAERLGVKRSTVNNWETGGYNVKADDIENICREFNVSADWLLGLLPENNYSNDQTIKMVSEYTGLSTKAVESLHNMDESYKKALMPVFEDKLLPTVGGFLKYAFRSVSMVNVDERTPWIVPDTEETKVNDDGTIDKKLSPKEAARDFLRYAKETVCNILESIVVEEWNEGGVK